MAAEHRAKRRAFLSLSDSGGAGTGGQPGVTGEGGCRDSGVPSRQVAHHVQRPRLKKYNGLWCKFVVGEKGQVAPDGARAISSSRIL